MKKKTIVLAVAAMILLILITPAQALRKEEATCKSKWLCMQSLTSECQNFYNDSSYYTVAKWVLDETGTFTLSEHNTRYRYFDTNLEGTPTTMTWSSSPSVNSVVAGDGYAKTAYKGGESGGIASSTNITNVLFCGHRSRSGGSSGGIASPYCAGADCGNSDSGSGVPEFPAFSAIAAVLAVTLGIVFLRKN